MQYFPPEITEQIIDNLAAKNSVLTIALAQTSREFYTIIAERYKVIFKDKYKHINMIASDLFTLGCHKLALYYASYMRPRSDSLGVIYNDKIFSHSSPQNVKHFIEGIIPKYLTSWPDINNIKFISFATIKIIDQHCSKYRYNITNSNLMRIIRVGCNKAAKWALDRLIVQEYDFTLAHILLERGNTALIRKLMNANVEIFLGDGAIKAAIKGNCEREIFDLLYGLGISQSCHDIDNSISNMKGPEMLRIMLELNGNLHDHTERCIMNVASTRPDLTEELMSTRTLSVGAFDCIKSALGAIIANPRLLKLLCDQLLGNVEGLHKIITKCTIEQLRAVFDHLHITRTLAFRTLKASSSFIERMLRDTNEITITDKTKSKIWLLHIYRFALPSDIIQTMYKYDSVMLSHIVCEQREIAPIYLMTQAKVGSKIRAYYADVCSKLTPLLAMSPIASQIIA